MRAAAATAAVLALIAAGCTREVPALKAKVKSVTPARGRQAGGCAGSEAVVEEAWVKCITVVRGSRRAAIAVVSRRLRKEGYRLGCEDELGELELVAVRKGNRVIASARPGAITFDESDNGKPLDVVDAEFAPQGSRRIPPGFVGLKITADTFRSPPASYPLPAGSCPS